jgi:hypothetical protein
MLRADIVRAISNKLEATILGDAAGNAKQPGGLFNGASALADTSYASMVDMIQTLEEANVSGDIKYIVSPSIKASLKTSFRGFSEHYQPYNYGGIITCLDLVCSSSPIKKVWAPLKTAVIPNPNALARREPTVSLFLQVTSL